MSGWAWVAVAALGGIGALARLAVDAKISRHFGDGLPLGTLVINLSGAFVLGLLSGLGVLGEPDLLVGTALIGSYTTFSTWMLESYRLVEDAETLPGLGNAVVSLLLGFVACLIGRVIGLGL